MSVSGAMVPGANPKDQPMTATKTTARDLCAHSNGLRINCQRKGIYRLTGQRGCFCQQHAEIRLGRALTDVEKS